MRWEFINISQWSKARAKALRHFKVDQVLKIDATFHRSLDLCEIEVVSLVLGRSTEAVKLALVYKRIESLPQTQMFSSLYLCNLIILSNRNQRLKYLRSTTLGCKDIGIRQSEFVAKTQFLCLYWSIWIPKLQNIWI